ncbi:hypothetical protein VPG01_078 [Vibrio phage VPG01]|nr:hypothetical protein VPG01_078 [Vibrio phage VPG01]
MIKLSLEQAELLKEFLHEATKHVEASDEDEEVFAFLDAAIDAEKDKN